jgi:hypothetical protein
VLRKANEKLNKLFKKLKHFIKYLVVWISQNLSIPFWMLGHFHLMTTIYKDFVEIIASFSMNIIVAIGFFIDYFESLKKK